MSVSQITNAAVNDQAEAHFALASGHLQFSLLTIHRPPTEYSAIGQYLSARRYQEAESGQSHETAAKLGILFEGLAPLAPDLIKAYGLRCSEIVKSERYNPKGADQHGLFKDQVGVDGTTLWAAATTSRASIAVHLLACMLARWDAPEAISIWMEPIDARKRELEATDNILARHASTIELTRDQIARWDASARALCLTADEAFKKDRTQLLLMTENTGLSVNHKRDMRSNVIDAWQTAMTVVNRVLTGEHLTVTIGAPMLGLDSWHLYPDMLVYGSDGRKRLVQGRDGRAKHLKPPQDFCFRGRFSLGIQDSRRQGIYWSLPLAHLKSYGDPVQSELSLLSQNERVTMDQLLYVALGSLVRRWLQNASEIKDAARFITQLYDYISHHGVVLGINGAHSWLYLLDAVSRELLKTKDSAAADLLRLIKCGRRRYPFFIDDLKIDAIFGLSNIKTALRLLNGNRARVQLLRELAKDFCKQAPCEGIVAASPMTIEAPHMSDSEQPLLIIQCARTTRVHWEISTVSPVHHGPMNQITQIRWIYHGYSSDLEDYESDTQSDALLITLDTHIPQFSDKQESFWNPAPSAFYAHFLPDLNLSQPYHQVMVKARFVCGDPHTAALYSLSIMTMERNFAVTHIQDLGQPPLPNIFLMRHISFALEHRLLDALALLQWLIAGSADDGSSVSESTIAQRTLIRSLRALSTAHALYQCIPGATIDLRVAQHPISQHQWLPAWVERPQQAFQLYQIGQEEAFACITRFESAKFNFKPEAMRGVLAISSGNSLYIAKCLLQDPADPTTPFGHIERVIGNIGRPGMALLVSPKQPRVRSFKHNFALVNHESFDGTTEDCFALTTLHISFTDWELPLDTGVRGIRDREAYYLETAVGIFDRGEWVADINPLDIYENKLFRTLPPCQRHFEEEVRPDLLTGIVCIDNWEELLDPPPDIGVVRAKDNWQARLAAAALSIQRGHETRLLPNVVCWRCWTQLEPLKTSKKTHEDEAGLSFLEDDPIGLPVEGFDEEASDSDIDEDFRRGAMRKRKRISTGDPIAEADIEDHSAFQQVLHHNIVYIL